MYRSDDEIKAYLFMVENILLPRLLANNSGGGSGGSGGGGGSGGRLEEGKWSVLIDVSGIRMPPTGFLTKLNKVFGANYPERLHRTVM